MSVPIAQLSCQQCQRRKTKCNKEVPCSACLKADITCTAVQRHRLPRGRSGKPKSAAPGGGKAVTDRIERLEALVAQLQSKGISEHASLIVPKSDPEGSPSTVSIPVESFVASNFWSELSDAVAGLRDVLENPDADHEFGEEYTASSSGASVLSPGSSSTGDINYALLGASTTSALASTSHVITAEVADFLLTTYKARVDAIFKVLHWPATLALLHPSGVAYPENKLSPSARALKCSMYFTASCALSVFELEQYHIDVAQLRHSVEEAFAHAHLLTTTDFTVLQAFVIYLAGLRASQANAQQWTLVPTAIRMASAQGIPSGLSASPLTVGLELRRRLWFSIGILDAQSAFDRGTRPLLSYKDFQDWPSHFNDSEMPLQHESILEIPSRVSNFTEVSFNIFITRGAMCQRLLSELASQASQPQSGSMAVSIPEEQLAIYDGYTQFVEQIPRTFEFPPSAVQEYCIAVAREQVAAVKLLLYRPLTPGVVAMSTKNGQLPEVNILATAVDVLERVEAKSRPEFAQWQWFSWPKWYALAVALAELCTAQGPQADRAWEIAQQFYDQYAEQVADSKGGLLWRPIARLMRKVQNLRGSRLPESATAPADSMQYVSTPLYNSKGESASWMMTQDPASDLPQLAPGPFDASMPDMTQDVSWMHWNMYIDDFRNDELWKV